MANTKQAQAKTVGLKSTPVARKPQPKITQSQNIGHASEARLNQASVRAALAMDAEVIKRAIPYPVSELPESPLREAILDIYDQFEELQSRVQELQRRLKPSSLHYDSPLLDSQSVGQACPESPVSDYAETSPVEVTIDRLRNRMHTLTNEVHLATDNLRI